jgi:superfamily II DNA or RNA helicase
MPDPRDDELAALRRDNLRLREENDRLREGIGLEPKVAPSPPSRQPASPSPIEPDTRAFAVTSTSPPAAKIGLFRSLFRGREDLYAKRWESKAGKSGYAPVCANEWRDGLCDKRRVKCAECPHRELVPLDERAIEEHLTGRTVLGVYPMLEDESCHFLAIDFDDAAWRDEVVTVRETCDDLGLPAYVEVSRSGQGAHLWLFFSGPVAASRGRRLGSALLTRAARRRRVISLTSYDRLFPSQDTLPRGGFGSLIALPLQQKARARGGSVFVDAVLTPHADQWALLSSIERIDGDRIDAVLAEMGADGGILGVRSYPADDRGGDTPWVVAPPKPMVRPEVVGHVPDVVRVVRANLVYVEKTGLPDSLLDQITRLAAFENPEFYRAQAMRLPTYDKPRVIACAQEFDTHVGLPRGCLDELREVMGGYGTQLDIADERTEGASLLARFCGTLRPEQRRAVKALVAHDEGVLSAETAFGKTIVAAKMIAERGVSTLVLVHRRELMEQWRERLSTFLEMPGDIGIVGGGKRKPTGGVDIAVMQSLVRRGQVDEIVAGYGQVIVDECHHVSAFSFEAILRAARARYVLGLTATPIRKDGHHPIITMQCGPVRFKTNPKKQAAARPFEHIVKPRITAFGVSALAASGVQEVYRLLAEDAERNAMIVEDVAKATAEGRSSIVLTERTAHRDSLTAALSERVAHVFALASGAGARKRAELAERMAAVPEGEPRVLVATGRLVGEGFDDARLDTLFLAMPISWRGTLQQYAGRLHRLHDDKREVIIYDYVDEIHPMMAHMWEKRLRGYRAMGYRVD